IYFITTCTFKRRAILASKEVAAILTDEWRNARSRHGWAIGRYVIMPNHVHFFCSAELGAKTLPMFVQAWKQWTSKRVKREVNLAGIIICPIGPRPGSSIPATTLANRLDLFTR